MMQKGEKESIVKEYFNGNIITALISIKANTNEIDSIARSLLEYSYIEDVFLVTGEVDLILKAKFLSYDALKNFILDTLGAMSGVQDTATMMVVTSYKERGIISPNFKISKIGVK